MSSRALSTSPSEKFGMTHACLRRNRPALPGHPGLLELHGAAPEPGGVHGLPVHVLAQAIDHLHREEGDEEHLVIGQVSNLRH